MRISAQVSSSFQKNNITLRTEDDQKSLVISPKADGYGLSVNGGELLFLALATCFCNDLYREAKRRNLEISNVDVEVFGDFGAEGEPAQNISYKVSLEAPNLSQEEIACLIKKVDEVAEIHKTLRNGIEINLR